MSLKLARKPNVVGADRGARNSSERLLSMKQLSFAGIGVAVGFVSALALFDAAQGATNVFAAYHTLDLFTDALHVVRTNYVREVDESDLVNGAINGMVTSLDPHSSYMTPKEYADMQVRDRGVFGGVGLELTMEDGLIKIVDAIDDTPASRAGLKTGDFISAIDGTSIEGLALNDAVDRLRGPENSTVTLAVLRKDQKTPTNITLTRSVVHAHSVKYSKKGDIGYIKIASFVETTDADLKNAIADIKSQPGEIRGYVLDLRNDPRGLLDQAISVSGDFLPEGKVVVSTRGRNAGETRNYNSHGRDLTDGKPIIVVVNEGSASAAEIVAGALQDQKRATIVGVTSFGKGSVQSILPLSEAGGGALRLTTSRYYTPSGRSIQATGIAPDVAVSNLTEKEQAEADQSARRTEASLAGHLDSEGAKRNIKMPTIHPEDGKKYDDFQLAYAIDRLDGKAVATATSPNSASPDKANTTP